MFKLIQASSKLSTTSTVPIIILDLHYKNSSKLQNVIIEVNLECGQSTPYLNPTFALWWNQTKLVETIHNTNAYQFNVSLVALLPLLNDNESLHVEWSTSGGIIFLAKRSLLIIENKIITKLCSCSMQKLLAQGCRCGGS